MSLFTIDQAPQILMGIRDTQGGAMNHIVIAGMHLPDIPVTPEVCGDIEDGVEEVRDHVVAQHLGTVVQIEFIFPTRAEIPSFSGITDEFATGWEKRADLRDVIGGLVQFEER